MFSKLPPTKYPPSQPQLVWDGKCGFCKYWVLYWKKNASSRVEFVTYQEAAGNYQDVPLEEFKKASRFIETDGCIYSGPDSAFRTLLYFKKSNSLFHNWYHRYRWFSWVSDTGYHFIATHRPFMFRLTHLLFGKNPTHLQPYWAIYLFFLVLFVLLLLFL